jgi:hypothetical protein
MKMKKVIPMNELKQGGDLIGDNKENYKNILRPTRICAYCKRNFDMMAGDDLTDYYELNEHKINLGLGTIRNFAFCSLDHLFSFLLDLGGSYVFAEEMDKHKNKRHI